jgi:hypothetical protein
MYTSILLVALAGTQAPAEAPGFDWKQDYATASREGKNARKPLAVVVGHGADGWSALSETGHFGPEVRSLLGKSYVCLYVNRDTAEGRALAADLELPSDGPALVISDSRGELQAFRHAGKLSLEDLSRYLSTYSDPDRVVTRTDIPGRTDVRFYPNGGGYGYGAPAFGSVGCPSCGRR